MANNNTDVAAAVAELKEAFNGLAAKHNELLAAFTDLISSNGVLEARLQAVELGQRQLAAAPPPANIGIDLGQLLERVSMLETSAARIPLNPMQAKQAQEQALQRESRAHGGDLMMYHAAPGPGILPTRIVRNDAEEKQALMDGYHPSLEQAAKATLGEKATDPKAVAVQMDKLRATLFKAA